jgi:hypothetical protein
VSSLSDALGLGLGTFDQLVPFHDSASVWSVISDPDIDCKSPTAMQLLVVAQETPKGLPGLGTIGNVGLVAPASSAFDTTPPSAPAMSPLQMSTSLWNPESLPLISISNLYPFVSHPPPRSPHRSPANGRYRTAWYFAHAQGVGSVCSCARPTTVSGDTPSQDHPLRSAGIYRNLPSPNQRSRSAKLRPDGADVNELDVAQTSGSRQDPDVPHSCRSWAVSTWQAHSDR